MSDSAVRRRVVQLMTWRLVITTILLGSAAGIQLNTSATAQPEPLYLLIGWIYALSAGYALSLRLTAKAPWLVDAQLALDALAVAAVVWVTGGILIYFSFEQWLLSSEIRIKGTIKMPNPSTGLHDGR